VETDWPRFKGLVHYVIWKCTDPAKLGAVKLNKACWLSDTRAYALHKRPITGATYIREKYGPVPRDVMIARRELVREGRIKEWRDSFFNREKFVFRSLVPPAADLFSSEEKQIIDYAIRYVTEEHTATSISDETHDYVWEIAKLGEEIPYHAIFATRAREPNDEELAWAKSEARRLGLAPN
jgi:hypothetical protein